jgi:hypothetical protein
MTIPAAPGLPPPCRTRQLPAVSHEPAPERHLALERFRNEHSGGRVGPLGLSLRAPVTRRDARAPSKGGLSSGQPIRDGDALLACVLFGPGRPQRATR